MVDHKFICNLAEYIETSDYMVEETKKDFWNTKIIPYAPTCFSLEEQYGTLVAALKATNKDLYYLPLFLKYMIDFYNLSFSFNNEPISITVKPGLYLYSNSEIYKFTSGVPNMVANKVLVEYFTSYAKMLPHTLEEAENLLINTK